MSRTRAIRFSKEEEKFIEEFLNTNSFFDFSSLARIAIMNFVKNPTVTIRPIKSEAKKLKSNTLRSSENGNI